jgi:ComF family protein
VIDVHPDQASAWRALTRFLRSRRPTKFSSLLNPLDALSCVLLPASCALCQHSLLRLSSVPVCDDCWNHLVPQRGSLCTRCGEELGIAEFSTSNRHLDEASGYAKLCRSCETVEPAFEQAVAFGNYEGTMRRLIHLLKYDGMEPVANMLGARLAPQVSEICKRGGGEILVVPVPLHKSKRRERGFNQAQLLARATIRAVRRLEPAVALQLATSVLERSRATESQSGLSTHQRRRNLRGAFFVSKQSAEKIAGRDVLLIDDIYTTGATARACSRVLKNAGAARVWVATVARAQREGVARWDPTMFTGVTAGFGASTGMAMPNLMS